MELAIHNENAQKSTAVTGGPKVTLLVIVNKTAI